MADIASLTLSGTTRADGEPHEAFLARVATSPSTPELVPSLVKQVASLGKSANLQDYDDRIALLEAAQSLVYALQTPREAMNRHCWELASTYASVEIGIDLGLFAILSKDEKPKSAAELAKATGADPALLRRILKHLSTVGVILEAGPNEYRRTGTSITLSWQLCSDSYACATNSVMFGVLALPAHLKENGYVNPTNGKDCAFQRGYKTDLHFFEYMKANPKVAGQFNNHMAFYRQGRPSWMDVGFYDVPSLIANVGPNDVLLVDLGGGLGHDISEFRRKWPDAPGRLVLQDTPELTAQSKKKQLHPSIEPMVHDFFTEQPIKGARAYYFHTVVHDWSDDNARKMLKAIAEAMKPGFSKLLINDLVITDTGAYWETTSMDIIMMADFATTERTEAEWHQLVESAGLKITKIWNIHKGVESVIEYDNVGVPIPALGPDFSVADEASQHRLDDSLAIISASDIEAISMGFITLEREMQKEAQRQAKEEEEEGARSHAAHTESVLQADADQDNPEKNSSQPGSKSKSSEAEVHAEATMKRIEWQRFRTLPGQIIDLGSRSVLEILIGEPETSTSYDILDIPIHLIATDKSDDILKDRKTATKSLLPGQAPLPERIRINSVPLLHLLAMIQYKEVSYDSGSLIMTRPFKALSYYEKDFRLWHDALATKPEDRTKDTEDTESIPEITLLDQITRQDWFKTPSIVLQHLTCLLDFIDDEITAKKEYLTSENHQMVTFADLWYLFKPGDEVIGHKGLQAYRILSVTSPKHQGVLPWDNFYNRFDSESEEKPMRIHCVYVDFDDKQLGPVSEEFEIEAFDGEKSITLLPVQPLRFSKTPGLREKLIQRGREFITMTAVKHMHCSGLTLDTRDEVDGQVVIYFSEALSVPANKDWKPEIEELLGNIPDAEAGKNCSAQCSPLDLADLVDFRSEEDSAGHKRETPFDKLVLPPGHKQMVQSLIAQHFRDKESGGSRNEQVDFARGKGKGLIMLLHGAPGVGKTSTAECIADLFQKPLFQITCGDLGSSAKEVEEALETNFSLANRWGCILLLDEADVFLAARTPTDFTRNGLVAVFLRVLEYYAGILFLTTNRVGDFDEAFASRIHISLYYPPLTLISTIQVFQLNLAMIIERFQTKGRKIHIDKQILEFVSQYFLANEKARLNGREIRNACQTALALAEFEAQGGKHDAVVDAGVEVRLQEKHLKTVTDAYLEFAQHLKDIFGAFADERAQDQNLRAQSKMSETVNPLLSYNSHASQPSPPTLNVPVAQQGYPSGPMQQPAGPFFQAPYPQQFPSGFAYGSPGNFQNMPQQVPQNWPGMMNIPIGATGPSQHSGLPAGTTAFPHGQTNPYSPQNQEAPH
ncbi:hypothetical protein PEX2_056390 [Penicillium expansum]|uniref:AAA+ ATPase domain-containing protein n=1 Tax=Penicillium expansum TaxID=27334 RepID=A0A0A2J5Z7_PENEN|nr:hypothetical protein PEX2_056390 [Penicillium expansum]KGO50161.1 hypothetical protein PEX2_056390 [Penicillium expansum]